MNERKQRTRTFPTFIEAWKYQRYTNLIQYIQELIDG